MSNQLTKDRLRTIRHLLVKGKFDKKIKELNSKVSKSIIEKYLKEIPECIVEAYNKTPEKERNKYFQLSSSIYVSSYNNQIFPILTSMFPNDETFKDIMEKKTPSQSFSIHLNECIPASNSLTVESLVRWTKEDKEFARDLLLYLKTMEDQHILDKKLECVFSSKRFYPNTLKNEFPEAYQIYMQLEFPEQATSGNNFNECDAVENVRAILNSGK